MIGAGNFLRQLSESRIKGSVFIEILAASVIIVVVLIPLLTGFSTGVKQTQAAKSYLSAQAVGTWAIAYGKAQVSEGVPDEGVKNITPLADESIKEVAEQLPYLDVRLKLSSIGSSGRCFSIGATVSWKDQKINKRRVRRFQSITRSEI
jgi:hypothetical protein